MSTHVLTSQKKAMKALRSIIMVSLFLLHPFIANATGSASDIIYINGVQWGFLEKPIASMDSVSYFKFMDFLPKKRCYSTANWEGYTGYWTIKDQQLYLLKVEVEMYENEDDESYILTLDADTLKSIFAPYYTQDGIFAQWFSRDARAAKGKAIRYQHADFNRNLEEEYIMTIRNGKVLNEKHWHNSRKAGLKLGDSLTELEKRFPIHLFPELQGKRIFILLSGCEMLSDGHFVDCHVIIDLPDTTKSINDQDHPFIKAFKDTMKSIYPWEVLYINGRYTMEFNTITFPIMFGKKE